MVFDDSFTWAQRLHLCFKCHIVPDDCICELRNADVNQACIPYNKRSYPKMCCLWYGLDEHFASNGQLYTFKIRALLLLVTTK